MSYIQEDRLQTLIDLPVQLPQTSIPPGGWTAIATIQVPTNGTLTLSWLQIYIAALDTVNTTTASTVQNVINPDYLPGSLVSVFLIQNWSPSTEPWTQTIMDQVISPADYTTAAVAVPPTVVARSLATPLTITAAGTYTFVVLNNSTNVDVELSVSGTVTLDIDALIS